MNVDICSKCEYCNISLTEPPNYIRYCNLRFKKNVNSFLDLNQSTQLDLRKQAEAARVSKENSVPSNCPYSLEHLVS